MISEFFLNIIFNIVSGLLSLLPDITWSVETSAFEYFVSIIQCVGYLLPWGTVSTIVSLIVALSIFRIIIAIIKSVWDLLPLV